METPMARKGIEKPDWNYKEKIKFEKMPVSDGDHWYHLQVQSFGLNGWTSLGRFNRTMILDLFINCHDALEECRALDDLEELLQNKTPSF